ncbi:MAG TPA: GatB/YqeY domain-containing protein [Candidatus Saccharimonadales bacterium]|nr:GatB/YqeY domain-containing protein [Candidatus Saccharimonadales bacterium]
MLKDKLNADIKTALLAGDKPRAEILKSLKSAILYEEVALKVREEGLPDDKIEVVLAREAKKRADAADLYAKNDQPERAAIERAEKEVIESYLPKQLSDTELAQVVDEVIAGLGADAQMGPVIGAVKAKVGTAADGARVAAAVKAKLVGS